MPKRDDLDAQFQVAVEEKAKESIEASVGYFKAMTQLLHRDVGKCSARALEAKARFLALPAHERDESEEFLELDFWYRTLLRAFMSEVEGTLFVMRQIVMWAHDRGEIELDTGEAVLVRERSYRVNVEHKRVEPRDDQFNRLLENFVLTFMLFPRALKAEFKIDFGSHGWQMLQEAVKLRNDFTHPHGAKSLLLPPGMYPGLSEAMSWFYSLFTKILTTSKL